jgi:predicted ATPase
VFYVSATYGPRFDLKFRPSVFRGNRVTVLTGPNGSGKTGLLNGLVNHFVHRSKRANDVVWSVVAASEPSKVIAQTFSPFSRFASPDVEKINLTDIYNDGKSRVDRYKVIGLHRKSRYVGGVLSRHTLEQGIFRLSEAPEQTRAVGRVLEELGFADEIHLVYRRYPGMRDLTNAYRRGTLKEYIFRLVNSSSIVKSTFVREASSAGPERLAELLESAISLLSDRLESSSFDLRFHFGYGRASEDYAVMQALALLRRLRILRLEQCNLIRKLDGAKIDLANASSGQQQILCSILGLVSELESDSLVLIDEPELSLHPTWQMEFLNFLSAVAEQFYGCHFFIATHSPLIVQSAIENDMEVVQLRGTDSISFNDEDISTEERNASVEGTLVEVFRTPIPGSTYLANEIFEIVVAGEEGDNEMRTRSLARLNELRDLYRTRSFPRNQGDLKVLDEAIELVGMADETDGNENDIRRKD